MQINHNINNGKYKTFISKQCNTEPAGLAFLNNSEADKLCFTGLNSLNKSLNKYQTKPKAILLALMTLVSGGNLTSKLLNNGFSSRGVGLFAEELPGKTVANLPNLIIHDESEYTEIINKLSKDIYYGKSYYKDLDNNKNNTEALVIGRKLADYTKMLNEIPESVLKKGSSEIAKYKSAVVSILENCSEYGAMYINNMPDKENMALHASGINRLIKASEQIQGCKLKNCAILNGLTADELMKKVVIPNEKIANGEIIGENQNTLVMITHEQGIDTGNGFFENFKEKVFTQKNVQLEYKNYKYDESFLGHYDNVVILQPNGIDADTTLNNAFEKIENSLSKGANIDISYMAHGSINGAKISNSGTSNTNKQVNDIDTGDFKTLDDGGEKYAQCIERIFANSIDNGYKPRFIPISCSSDLAWQNLANRISSDFYKGKVLIFGSPYSINDTCMLGFIDNKLCLSTKVNRFSNNAGLIIDIKESDKINSDWYKADTFALDPLLKQKILNDEKLGISTGTVVKPNGLTMEYDVIRY